MKILFFIACILLIATPALHAEDSVAIARDLYTAANYEDALVVLSRLDSPSSQPGKQHRTSHEPPVGFSR